MNERIKQLEKQCWDHQTNHLNSQRFAESIIKECVARCEFVANLAFIANTGEIAFKTQETANNCATMIKQHFGIK